MSSRTRARDLAKELIRLPDLSIGPPSHPSILGR